MKTTEQILAEDRARQEAKEAEFTKPHLRSDFTAPDLDTWSVAQIEYFNNEGKRGKCDHVIKAIISTEPNVKDVNLRASREVIFNLFPAKDFHLKVRDLTQSTIDYNRKWSTDPKWKLEKPLDTDFNTLQEIAKDLFDQNIKFPGAPLTQPVVGWCQVRAKPFGTHYYANMMCVMEPYQDTDADGVITYGATIAFNIDGGDWSEMIVLKDVTSRKKINKEGLQADRHENASKLVGYLDRVNFKDEYKKRKQVHRLLKKINYKGE